MTTSLSARIRMIFIVGVIAALVFAPWVIRDWIEFGSPFPGQALTNALSIQGTDIFAWNDPPTLARYLSVGPGALVKMRVDGLLHNLFNVLVLPGMPASLVGLVGLWWFGRSRSLRPLVAFSVLVFTVSSLLFPISTTWGTFLHAAGAIHVLLIVSCLQALDAVIARAGVIRGWTKPVAWLGATLTIAGAVLFSGVLLPTFGQSSRDTSDQYQALVRELAATGLTPAEMGPMISDHPIWLADTGARTLALPDEPPRSILNLATTFGASVIVVSEAEPGADLPTVGNRDPGLQGCFQELQLKSNTDLETAEALGSMRVFQIVAALCR